MIGRADFRTPALDSRDDWARIAVALVLLCGCISLPSEPARTAEPGAAEAADKLWSNTGDARVVCEPHVLSKAQLVLRPGESKGLHFVTPREGISRIELEVHNRDTAREARARLWRWRGTRATTRAADPIVDERWALGFGGAWVRRSLRPTNPLTPGATHYFEITGVDGDGIALRLGGERKTKEPAACARALPREHGDDSERARIWFRLHTNRRVPDSIDRPQRANGAGAAVVRSNDPLPSPRATPPRRHGRTATNERARLLERIEGYADHHYADTLKGCGTMLAELAWLEAFRFGAVCEDEACRTRHAERARQLLVRLASVALGRPEPLGSQRSKACPRMAGPQRGPTAYASLQNPAEAYRRIQTHPSLSRADHDLIRRALVQQADANWKGRWGGTYNQSLVSAAGYAALAEALPDHDRSRAWRGYADSVLDEFERVMETEEDASSYLANAWIPGILATANVLDREPLLTNPRFLALVDRFAEYVSPLGLVPAFGDGSGFAFDAPGLIWLFEATAARTGDGRYREVAARVRNFNRTRAIHEGAGVDSWGRFIDDLARAWMATDWELKPVAPSEATSTITYRRPAYALPRSEWGNPPRAYAFSDARVPDKLVLRSGPDPDDLYASFNLLGGLRHGHPEQGALTLLHDGGSVLITSTAYPYFRHEPHVENENTAMIRRRTGGAPIDPRQSVDVELFEDDPMLTTVWLSWDDPNGWNARIERRIYFLKNRAIWIRDRFRLPQDLGADVATRLHVERVDELHGPDWWNTTMAAPYRNVWRYKNPPHHAMVWLPATDRGNTRIEPRPEFGPTKDCGAADLGRSPTTAGCRASPALALSRTARIAPGDATPVFDTIIVPTAHPATPSPGDDDLDVDIELTSADWTTLRLRIGDERWRLIDTTQADSVEQRWTRETTAPQLSR